MEWESFVEAPSDKESNMERRSAKVTQGVERAPMRSLFYAMGYTKEELDRPLIRGSVL